MSNSEPNAVPPSVDPRVSDAASTDAVKEAMRELKSSAHNVASILDSLRYGFLRNDLDWIKGLCSAATESASLMESLLAALADAERKLEDAEGWIEKVEAECRTEQARTREWALALQSLTPGGSEYVDDPAFCVTRVKEGRESQYRSIINAVRQRNEAEAKLSAAEKRAKEAESRMLDLRSKGNDFEIVEQIGDTRKRLSAEESIPIVTDAFVDLTKGYETAQKEIAVRTRKLATARNAIYEGLRLIGYPPDGTNIRNDEIKNFHDLKVAFDNVLAAIDAPAGEEAPANGMAGVSIASLPPSDQMCSFTYWATVPPGITKPMSRCINAKPCALHPAAPPPEPANAQGSEAIVQPHCALHWSVPVTTWMANACTCDLPKPPSPPPFTLEEVRESARAHATAAARLRSDDDDMRSEATERLADEHSRTQATLRHYADLLERDDALERAADEVLREFDATGTGSRFLALKNLRSVLAQRAKGRK